MLVRLGCPTLLLVLVACDSPNIECEAAAERVADCYGAEVGAAFASTCTSEAAVAALDEACLSPEEGKEDSFSTTILSPPIEHFKYGSIGSDKMGMPLAVMQAIPLVCEDTLPAGTDPLDEPYAAFGLIYEPGELLPIGFSVRTLPMIGVRLVGNNCAGCHTSTVRDAGGGERTVYFGAPATRFDIEAYNAFLVDCVTDPDRFNAVTLGEAFDQLDVSFIESLLAFKSEFIAAFVEDLKEKVNSVVRDGAWGPGRDDATGLVAALVFPQHLPADPAPVDFPSAWNQKVRNVRGIGLHWDGNSGSGIRILTERQAAGGHGLDDRGRHARIQPVLAPIGQTGSEVDREGAKARRVGDGWSGNAVPAEALSSDQIPAGSRNSFMSPSRYTSESSSATCNSAPTGPAALVAPAETT